MMRGTELLEKMELVDPAYVAAADVSFKAKKKIGIKLGVMAACICLLLGTAFAAGGYGTRLIDLFSGRTELGSDYSESGYDVSVEIERVPVSALSEELQQVGDMIVQQFESYELWNNHYPGSWEKSFSFSEEARSYIGFDSLKGLDWDLQEGTTTLDVMGNSRGELLSVSLETDYQVGQIRLQAYSHLYTEYWADEITTGSRSTEYLEFTETFYTTGSGKRCQIIASTAMESGYLSMDGYLVQDGVLYTLHIAYLEEDAAQAEALLYQWADLF